MSTVFKKAFSRRKYRERGQPSRRRKLGLLEKHQDYVLRAQDYHQKQRRLKALKEKAATRNPDEFYHQMIHSQIRSGKHVASRQQRYSEVFLQRLRAQDLSYVQHKMTLEKSKIVALRDTIDMTDEQQTAKHTLFMDNQEEANQFDPVVYFDTLPEYVSQRRLRPRLDLLKTTFIKPTTQRTSQETTQLRKEAEKDHRHLLARLDRWNKMNKMAHELVLQKQLMGKGKRRKVGKDSLGVSVYRWARERKT
jgi:U3 small nucleolar RNA-associated protein 11